MIIAKGLTKIFNSKKIPAVCDLNFEIRCGEIVGLLGENGAGKTTTLRMIAGILRPTAGDVFVNNYNCRIYPDKIREQVGILFGGDTGLYDRLTGWENIKYFADLFGLSAKRARDNIEKLVHTFNMEDYIDRRAGEFSTGMKQKTAIARSIVHDPPVMLFDEPSSGLDVYSSKVIQDFILQCRDQGKAVLFSSHKLEEVERLSDRVIIIHKGRLLEDKTLSELNEKYRMGLKDIFFKVTGEAQ